MRLRAVGVMLAMGVFGTTTANCGSDSGSVFLIDDAPDGGSSGSSGSPVTPSFGKPPLSQDGGTTTNGCKPLTCAELQIDCGAAGDGCGGLIESCGTCQGQETCGGGGTPSVCGGTAGCVPRTCADLGVECGPAGDGCGGVLDCKTCPSPQICGGGGPSKCGGGLVGGDGGVFLPDGGVCVPRTTCDAGECGPVADGCGGLLNCPSTCPAGQTCGGGGTASQCGAPACTVTTCAAAGANCGYIADGCGGSLDCGGPNACPNGQFCGGDGPNRCGDGGAPPSQCVNFCVDQNKNDTCAPGSKTKLRGTVFAPNGTLPLPDALVYIPNGSKTAPYGLAPFSAGVGGAGTCEQCTLVTDSLADTRSAADGSFVLDDVPPETEFPLVIQLGKWRRVVTISPLARCSDTTLTAEQTRLPKRQGEAGVNLNNIPRTAISTGYVDALECVFRKLGIEDDQFTNPGPSGRIHLYLDRNTHGGGNDGRQGQRIDSDTPDLNVLVDDQATLDGYDAVVFGCRGDDHTRTVERRDRVRAYTGKGGRVFATHFNYSWLAPNDRDWSQTINFTGNGSYNGTPSGRVITTFPRGQLFANWLASPGVDGLDHNNPPRISISEARNNAAIPVAAGAQEWIRRYDNGNQNQVFHYTFNTPWGAAPENQCGRVLFSSFHVSIGSVPASGSGRNFPNHCNSNDLTRQEKVLAFMLFDLTSCIEPTAPPPPPTCTPQTCQQQGIGCGMAGNGCGALISCGTCPGGQVCQGSPAQCVTPNCTTTTCAAQNAECGMIANGCGGSLDCGPCTEPGQVCGGAGPNTCGTTACTPITCEAQGIACGPAGNGCGDLIQCGDCPPGQTCGGGGAPGVCGAPNCTQRTCQDANATCGFVADGCGGSLDCGPCPPGQTCGGGGTPNQCGGGGGVN